jgi:hypothetical protein
MGKADDGGRIGYRQSPPAFSRRYDLCPRDSSPVSYVREERREQGAYFAHSPMPTFRAYPTLHRPHAAGGLPGLLRARNLSVN